MVLPLGARAFLMYSIASNAAVGTALPEIVTAFSGRSSSFCTSTVISDNNSSSEVASCWLAPNKFFGGWWLLLAAGVEKSLPVIKI
jgi:hypothetical protein